MNPLTLDHLDTISKAHDSLQAMAHFIDDAHDVNASGSACILLRIAADLERINTEASVLIQADREAGA